MPRGKARSATTIAGGGLCSPIDSLPYTITRQGSYCLVRNLSTPQATGNAITIASDFVTFDLKGFKVGGGAAGPGTEANGVYALNRRNITIRRGNIRGFRRAVFLEDSSGTLRISGTAFGVRYDSATGRYRDNLVIGTAVPYSGGTDAGNNQ